MFQPLQMNKSADETLSQIKPAKSSSTFEEVKEEQAVTASIKNHNRMTEISRGGFDRMDRQPPNDKDVRLTYQAEEDVYWLSRIVYAEALKDTDEGQIAVANVVLNRYNAGWSKTIKGVIFQVINGTHQFTPVKDQRIYLDPSDRAINNAIRALNGERIIPKNVYYFYMPRVYNQRDWIRTRLVYKKIGIHLFCY